MQTRKGNSNSICSSDHHNHQQEQQQQQPIPARWKLPRAPPVPSPVLGPLIGQTSSTRLAEKQNKIHKEDVGWRKEEWGRRTLSVDAAAGWLDVVMVASRSQKWKLQLCPNPETIFAQAPLFFVWQEGGAGREASLMFYLKIFNIILQWTILHLLDGMEHLNIMQMDMGWDGWMGRTLQPTPKKQNRFPSSDVPLFITEAVCGKEAITKLHKTCRNTRRKKKIKSWTLFSLNSLASTLGPW